MICGVDVGGTFTDVALWDGDELRTAKVPTTPAEDDGVLAGVRQVAEEGVIDSLLHGTTIATNALLQRAGARTALVTTAGFADVLEIGRQNRPSLYDTASSRAEPLVPRSRRFEVRERVAATGEALARLDGVDDVVAAVAAVEPDAIAIALLGSFARPAHEDELAAALGGIGASVSRSSRVAREFREYERTSTTVVNAYLTPHVAGYLRRLDRAVGAANVARRVSLMKSSGGLIDAAGGAELAAALLLSGPAGGVMAAAALGRALRHAHVISFDMGGTSTDVCRIRDGSPELSYERAIEGYACRMPALAVHTVGAGGGSIAWMDSGGALRVGPQSAGAHPGPACYGRGGTAATVSDANLALGRLGATNPLGGRLRLEPDLATAALRSLGSVEIEAAAGIIRVVEAHMVRAIRRVSVEEGVDPGGATLVAFGGAGGLHATALGRELGMAGVIIPPHAGVFSALGLLLSPPRTDAARTVLTGLDAPVLDAVAEDLARDAEEELRRAFGVENVAVSWRLDVRYVGQSHETSVPFEPGESAAVREDRFTAEHERRNGFHRRGDPVEAVTLRAEATAAAAAQWADLPRPAPSGEPERGRRPVWFAGSSVDAEVWWRPALGEGTTVTGPAVIDEPQATTWLAPGDRARVHDSGALEVEW